MRKECKSYNNLAANKVHYALASSHKICLSKQAPQQKETESIASKF
jgi:hypothetical protein